MRIAFLFCSFANPGGIERTLTDKANYLSAEGHQVTIVTYEQGNHPYAYDLYPTVRKTDLNCRYFTIFKYPFYQRIVRKMLINILFRKRWKRFVSQWKPDVVVTTTSSKDFMKETMSVSHLTKIIIEAHLTYQHDYEAVSSTSKKLERMSLLHHMKKCHMLIALTKQDSALWSERINNVVTLRNPIARYDEVLPDIKKEAGRIISVGRLHRDKRYDRLIKAFSILSDNYPEWYLDIYGGGEDRDSLQQLIQHLKLENRVILHTPTKNIYDEYLRSQFLVLSSDSESFSLVILEAMACGLPVVSTNCPYGPADIVEDGRTGLLCDMNEKSLSEKMEWMITHETERREMGIQARTTAACYKKDIVMKEWEKAYLSVV